MHRLFRRIQEKALDPGQPPVLIAAFGDSVTQGVMEHRILEPGSVYHRLLQEKLESYFPLTTFSTLNAGVSGGTVQHGLERLERDVIRHQPDLVLVAFGLNDSLGGAAKLEEFRTGISSLIGRIQKETEADIVVLTPPFMATKRTARIHPEHEQYAENIIHSQIDGILDRYADAIRVTARERCVLLADVRREWERLRKFGVDTDLWLANGLNHPTRAGHSLAADILFFLILREERECRKRET